MGDNVPGRITDDAEVRELRERLSALSFDRQRAVIEGVLSPRLRLWLLTQTVRGRVRAVSDAEIDLVVDEEIHEVRRARRASGAR